MTIGRTISRRLEEVWLESARQVGFQVVRTEDAYAAFDGRGRILIGADKVLDDDDWVPQLIYHELCHAAVEGLERMSEADWGLSNEGTEHLEREYACLRLQAALAAPHGLRALMAPTTEHRVFYSSLPLLPLAGTGAGLDRARQGRRRIESYPFAPHLEVALSETRNIIEGAGGVVRGVGGAALPGLEACWPAHPSGFVSPPEAQQPTRYCRDCAWYQGTGSGRCMKAAASQVPATSSACERFEEELECGSCGACCREGFDVVEVEAGERFASSHAGLLTHANGRLQLLRPEGKCVALERLASSDSPYRCSVYPERPDSCRAFEVGSDNCLEARKRAGVSG